MRLFLAGATGVIGRQLLPLLAQAGHQVTAMTRSEERARTLLEQGAEPVICDVYNQRQLLNAVRDAKPEIVIHQLTSLPKRIDPRKVREAVAPTNRIRTVGTWNLVKAARAAGARRVVAQSIAFIYEPGRTGPAGEDDSLYLDPPRAYSEMVSAVLTLERTVLGATDLEGVVLRYGYFYGPGTVYARDGSVAEDVRKRRFPIVGNGQGTFSFVHIKDAAAATVAALTGATPGIYNIVDDDPAPAAVWLPFYAEQLGASRPFRIPKLIGRLAAGSFAVYLMTQQRGASNRKARRDLGWHPNHSSWRTGFPSDLKSQ